MSYHINTDFADKKGIISNGHGFVNRNLDTGFKTKWSGYWTPPYKFLDYFAVKINGIWLDRGTLEAVDYGDEMVFHHETESLYIKEVVKTPEGENGFTLELEIENKTSEPKAIHTKVEPAVDIRKRDEDLSNQDYSFHKKIRKLKIKNSVNGLTIETNKDFQLEGDSYLKTHKPETVQRCFIPGHLTFKDDINQGDSSKICLSFYTLRGSNSGEIEHVEQSLEDNEFRRVFECAHSSLRNLIYTRKEVGIAAGHPWFQNYWGRDTFWSLLGLIDLGYFELSHEILENYSDKEGFPTRINLEGENEYRGGDEAPLFVIVSEKLNRHYEISEKISKKQEKAFEELELKDEIYVDHSGDASWMDTLERSSPCVDLQSLWLEAAKVADKDDLASSLENGLEDFVEEDYIIDCLEEKNGLRSINGIIPLVFNQISDGKAESILETFNGEFSSSYGARTASIMDENYDSNGYHTGSVWGLTTCWLAIANFQYDNFGQGVSYLEKFGGLIDEDQLGAFPELVNADDGCSLGCSEQAWSAGLIAHAIDSHMLGIKPRNGKVYVEPSGPVTGFRRKKNISGSKTGIKFDEGSVEVLEGYNIDFKVKEFDNN